MGLTLALPLGGMKAKVEYHTLTSPKKRLHGVSKLARCGGGGDYFGTTFVACGPFGPSLFSNSTF